MEIRMEGGRRLVTQLDERNEMIAMEQAHAQTQMLKDNTLPITN